MSDIFDLNDPFGREAMEDADEMGDPNAVDFGDKEPDYDDEEPDYDDEVDFEEGINTDYDGMDFDNDDDDEYYDDEDF